MEAECSIAPSGVEGDPPHPNKHPKAIRTWAIECVTLKKLCDCNKGGTQDQKVHKASQQWINGNDVAPVPYECPGAL